MLLTVDLADNSERQISLAELKDLRVGKVWLELKEPTAEELAAVAEKSGIPADFLEVPAVSNFINLRIEPEYVVINFVVVREILEEKKIDPLVVAFSKDLLVTVESHVNEGILGLVKTRMNKAKVDPPALVAYYILDEIVAANFEHLEKIEEVTAEVEEHVLEKADQATLKGIFRLKSRLISFNKVLWYERGLVFNLKKCEADCLTAKARNLFDTTHEYLARQIDIVETYREILSDAINAYLSTVSNRINASIRRLTFVMFYLTIVTTITSFPNTVATFFGIAQFGQTDALIIFTVLILSIALPFVWLWRRRWLKLD
jgi:magnesium transporter